MSALVDIAVGLILVYLVFSIVVSGLHEWWAQYFGQRGKFLHMGIRRLIGDDAIFVRVLQHPLIGSLYRDRAARGKPPAYVDSSNFALAFADVVLRRAAAGAAVPPSTVGLDFATLRAAVAQLRLQRSPAALSVMPILDRSKGDIDVALKGIETWFDSGMDRVSGWYKAYAQRRLFVWGLLLAALCNVDSIAIFQALDRSPQMRAALAANAQQVVASGKIGDLDLATGTDAPRAQARQALATALDKAPAGLPIGYACLGTVVAADTAATAVEGVLADSKAGPVGTDALRGAWALCTAELKQRWTHGSLSSFVLSLVGWIMTAVAGVLGAPYWFGLLTKVVNIRGAGPKPLPKKRDDDA